jgi:hypothetical protein
MEGGYLGVRRLIGVYQVVTPHIRPSMEVAAELVAAHSRVLLAGVPFGTSILGRIHGSKVMRLYYQPHFPNRSTKSLFINSPLRLPRTLAGWSHGVVDLVARALFQRHLVRHLNDILGYRYSWRDYSPSGHLLNESYWFGDPTIFAISEAFEHEGIRSAPNAYIAGFVRPPRLEPAPGSHDVIRRLGSSDRSSTIFASFGSMRSSKTQLSLVNLVSAAAACGFRVAVPASSVSALDRTKNVIGVPFGDHRDLFGVCGAVVHHGGAGTMLAAVDARLPAVIAPQWADQFYWAAEIARRGLGVIHKPHAKSERTWKASLDSLMHLRSGATTEACYSRIAGSDGLANIVERVVEFWESD